MKKYWPIGLLLSFLTFHLPFISAATYYASPEGGGDGKSYAQPTTFASGLKLLKNPGDTLYLLSGQYDLLTTDVKSLVGTADKRIVISGYEPINRSGKYAAILDFRKTAYGKRGLQIQNSSSFVHIKNLTLRYSGKNNLINYGSYNLFENLDIYGSADTGCQMKEGGNNIIRNVDSHDNFDYQTMDGTNANFGGNADGFADKQFSGAGNHYIGCRAWNNSDDGWDFFQRVSTSQTVIEHCICYRNGPDYYNMKNHPRYETDKAWFDSKVGTQMKDRYGQTITVTLEKYPCQGNGNGFKMGGGGTRHDLLIHHCLAVANNARGFDQNNDDGTMLVYNCSAYANTVNYGFTTKYGTNTLRNCISFQGVNGDSYKAKTVANNDHNSWNSGLTAAKSDFQSLDTTLIRTYRTSDGSLSATSFMYLVTGSKLIDAGIDVNLGYNGEAPDLGWCETDGEQHDPEPEPEPEPQPEGTHAVAFVSIPNAQEDQALLAFLKANESLWIVETDATRTDVDYSAYEVLVLGSKPASSALGFAALKGVSKPVVLLKPWLFKAGAWEWGTAINTQDLAVTVNDTSHPLFRRLTITDGQLALFSQCTTNAVTAISEWNNTSGVVNLANPVSQTGAVAVAEIPAGTNCNGTVLPQRLVMIGLSEYSLTSISGDGMKLVENAILYQLGMDIPTEDNHQLPITNDQSSIKFLQYGSMFIQAGGVVYDASGRRIRP